MLGSEWVDLSNGGTPPSYWNGTAFEPTWANNGGTGEVTMSLVGAPNAGDILTFTAMSTADTQTGLEVAIAGVGDGDPTHWSPELTSDTLLVGVLYTYTSAPFSGGENVYLQASPNTNFAAFAVTIQGVGPPPPPSGFWTDFIGTQEVDA